MASLDKQSYVMKGTSGKRIWRRRRRNINRKRNRKPQRKRHVALAGGSVTAVSRGGQRCGRHDRKRVSGLSRLLFGFCFDAVAVLRFPRFLRAHFPAPSRAVCGCWAFPSHQRSSLANRHLAPKERSAAAAASAWHISVKAAIEIINGRGRHGASQTDWQLVDVDEKISNQTSA